MIKKQLAIITIMLLIILTACEKNGNFENAIIKDYGDPAVDGCGWVIDISSTIYKPIDLPAEYQEDNLEVKIKYDLLETMANCGFAQNVYKEIEIEKIKKK